MFKNLDIEGFFFDHMGHILVSFFIIAIIIIILYGRAEYKAEMEKYNNGICECGGNYIFQQAIGHRVSTEYLYKCDSCGKLIKVCIEPKEMD